LRSIPGVTNIATQFGKTPAELFQIISECHALPFFLMTEIQQEILQSLSVATGDSLVGLLTRFKISASAEAEGVATALQDESDRATVAAELEQDDHPQMPHVPLDIPLEVDLEDNDEWEDEDDRPSKANLARFLPRPPSKDGAGNPFVTVVHTNGFHSLPVVWCSCHDQEDRDLQLLDLHLYPASYNKIGTVFTFALLDDHRYEYLECKSSRYQYHNKLRRLTCPEHPDISANRYTELGRVARQWRNLKFRRWFWVLDNTTSVTASMALFCAACPQPGISLPPDWTADYKRNP